MLMDIKFHFGEAMFEHLLWCKYDVHRCHLDVILRDRFNIIWTYKMASFWHHFSMSKWRQPELHLWHHFNVIFRDHFDVIWTYKIMSLWHHFLILKWHQPELHLWHLYFNVIFRDHFNVIWTNKIMSLWHHILMSKWRQPELHLWHHFNISAGVISMSYWHLNAHWDASERPEF